MFRRARRTYVAGRQGRQQGAPARMPTRITVRYLGSEVGKKVARPDTKGEVLELAAKRLNLSTPASRIFAASPTSGLYCTIGRRLCRPTGDVDGTQRLEGTCEPRTRTSTENGAFHPHCCTGGIGSIPHGTGPLDRLALPHWCVHWGGSYETY